MEPLQTSVSRQTTEMKEAEAIPSNLINKQIEIKSDNETNKEVINESPEKKPKVKKV